MFTKKFCFFLLRYIIVICPLLKNGVYHIIHEDNILGYKNHKAFFSPVDFGIDSQFRIKAKSKLSLYSIQQVSTNYFLYFNQQKNASLIWMFHPISNNTFIIQNKNLCFLKVKNNSIYCMNIHKKYASKMKLVKIYEEVENKDKENNLELILKEPIDLIIKYIDLSDKYLKRKGIFQIKKDLDNEELKYSLRSILKNIPWIRKIFIIMPNERIRFLKDKDIINNKIIYIKDKEILGYESSNSHAFQFRLWKLKKFCISDNVIVMDDDYFIGMPIKKSEFFYVENKKVVPAIITNNIQLFTKTRVINRYRELEKYVFNTTEEQTSNISFYNQYASYLFIFDLFNISSSIFFPKFTHNAIPINLKDLKELYDIVYKTKYKYYTLDALYRQRENLQFQTIVLSYTFIKFNKKVNNIPCKLINIKDATISNYNFPLFCINTGALNYSLLTFLKAKIIMNYLFPYPTKYEVLDNQLSLDILNLSTLLEQNLMENTNKMKNNYDLSLSFKVKLYFFNDLTIFILILIKLILKINTKF